MTQEEAAATALYRQDANKVPYAAYCVFGVWRVAVESIVVALMGSEYEPSAVVWSDELLGAAGGLFHDDNPWED